MWQERGSEGGVNIGQETEIAGTGSLSHTTHIWIGETVFHYNIMMTIVLGVKILASQLNMHTIKMVFILKDV